MKKQILFTLLIACISSTAFSQSTVLDQLIVDMERNKAMSLSYVEAMPADKFDYKPTDEVRSFAAQFLHISQGMIGLSSNGTGATPIFQGENLEATEAYHNKEEVTRILTASYDFAIKSMKEMDRSKLDEVVVRGQFEVTRLGWISKTIEHNTHHKGQSAVYLRMNGITPPQYQLF